MKTNTIVFDEERLTCLLKDLLSLDNNHTWACTTITHRTKIKFTGNKSNVQDNILKWLSVPERKENVRLLKTK